MVVLSVLYPNTSGSRFDESYYLATHIPLLRARWDGMGLTEVRMLRGTATPAGSPVPYRFTTLLTFSSGEALQGALSTHGAEILGDVPRFTDVQPLIQVNDPVD